MSDLRHDAVYPSEGIHAGSAAGGLYGLVVADGGEKGMRFSLPNSAVMVHQPSGGYQGQASDIMITARKRRETEARLTTFMWTTQARPRRT